MANFEEDLQLQNQLLANYVPRVSGTTGGLLQNLPIVCGGYDGFNSGDCVVIGQPEMEMKMIEKRDGAASVALDQSTLWIVGGSCFRVGRLAKRADRPTDLKFKLGFES